MVDDDDGRTTDHGHPISSPCEPNGSGELIIKERIMNVWLFMSSFNNTNENKKKNQNIKNILKIID